MLYIFGAGKCGQTVIKYFRELGIRPKAIFDNDKSKQGLSYLGVQIITPEALNNRLPGDVVLISAWDSRYEKDIRCQLENKGLKHKVDFYYAKEFCWHIEEDVENNYACISLPDGYYQVSLLDLRCFSILKADGTFYRYITPQDKKKFREIISRLELADMLGTDFIKLEESDELEQTHPDALFLKCETLMPDTNMRLWPPKMLKAFCLWHIGFIEKIDYAGLGFLDGHAYNATFSGGRFVYYDLGSINLHKTKLDAIKFFISTIINPLVLISSGETERVYKIFRGADPTLDYTDIISYMSENGRYEYEILMSDVLAHMLKGDVIGTCQLLKGYVKNLPIPDASDFWTDYAFDSLRLIADDNKEALSNKYLNVAKLIRKIKPSNFIDLAGSSGVISLMLKDEVQYAINVDVNLGALDFLWQFMVEHEKFQGSPIIPVRLNIFSIFEVSSRSNYVPFLKNTPVETHFDKRLKCDMAVCLSIIHHMVFRYALSFEQTLECFLFYTKKYLIIEFVDVFDTVIQDGYSDRKANFNWYTKENFERILHKYCNILEILPSDVASRNLYLCEIRESGESL